MAVSRRLLLGVSLCGALLTSGGASAAEQAKRVEFFGLDSAYLGVSLDEVTKDDVTRLKLAEERGALVRSVEDDSPAQKAGLKADDVIVRFQGEPIHSARQLSRLVREQPEGRTVSLEVVRGGASQRLQATLQERAGEWGFDMPKLAARLERDFAFAIPEPADPPRTPRAPAAPLAPFGKLGLLGGPRKLGIEYQELDGQLAKYFKLADDRGVLVSHVDEDGPAGKAGIKAGDVLLKLAGRPLRDGQDLRDELRKAEPGSELAVSVQRDGKPLELKLKLAAAETRRRRGMST